MIFNRILLFSLAILAGCGKKTSAVITSNTINQSSVLSPELLEEIYSEHTSQLPYTEIKQDPFVITFSGVPGMGKSFIAQKLTEHFKAVRIRNDDIRDMLKKFPGIDKQDQERALKEYLFYMLQRYNFPNRRLILDASIDRSYVQLFPYLEKHKIPFMVIRLDVPREIIIDRITQREGALAQNYLKLLDKSFENYEEFGSKYIDYFLFKNVPGASLDGVIDEIELRLKARLQEKKRYIMTIEDMKKLVKTHADLETKHDLEGVLATLVEDPVYEIYPAHLKLQGKENVRAFYREHFDSFFPLIASFQLINEWWTPESACMEYDLFLKEPYATKPYRILVVLTAKNNLLLGERFYVSEELAQIMSGTAFSLWKKL